MKQSRFIAILVFLTVPVSGKAIDGLRQFSWIVSPPKLVVHDTDSEIDIHVVSDEQREFNLSAKVGLTSVDNYFVYPTSW